MGFPVLNQLMEPMTLSDSQMADYKSRVFVDLAEGYPFPEDLVPKHATVLSRVPFMTLVSSFCDLQSGGFHFYSVATMWGDFCSSLGTQKHNFAIKWRQSETVVSCLLCFSPTFLSCLLFTCIPHCLMIPSCFSLPCVRGLLRGCCV